jgi:predicted O-linked N-acetylglucosamine transferase (SPINDLY family)
MNRKSRKAHEKQLKKNEDLASHLLKKSTSLMASCHFLEAINSLEKLIHLIPEHFLAWCHLGTCQQALAMKTKARQSYQNALFFCPTFFPALEGLGQLSLEEKNYEQALSFYQKAAALADTPGFIYLKMATVYEKLGASRQAYEMRQKAFKEHPSADTYFAAFYTFPEVLVSEEEEFSLQQNILTAPQHSFSDTDHFPRYFANAAFYSAYHRQNPKPILEKMAQDYLNYFPALAFEAPSINAALHTGKIGIVSTHLTKKNHAVEMIFAPLLQHLSKNNFDVTLFNTGPHNETFFSIKTVSVPRHIERARHLIHQEKIELLIYTDLGFDDFTYFLAFSRLAPIQVVLSGHPITSGIPTIDYYISAQNLETQSSQNYYTEKLILLDGIGSSYAYPPYPSPPLSRDDFGLPREGTLYLCPQSLFKIHPCMDPLINRILTEDKKGLFVLIESHPGLKEPLLERWMSRIPHVLNQIFMIPHQSFDRFLGMIQLSDVILDTFPFTSGNTAYQAFGAGRPIVTLPGPTARGRGTYSLYRQMGVEECIARDMSNYGDIALKLGQDPAYRQMISEKIKQKSSYIFNCPQVLDNYTLFIQTLLLEKEKTRCAIQS